ncbi:MAG: HAMP domain-containing protein [Burkholderiales bacterium]|nr:HAMP domain-containing protein [Burkholderiales bacterium]
MIRPTSLRAAIGWSLFVVLAAAAIPFSLLVAKFAREDLHAATSRHVVQVAETVVKSTRLAMLLDDREAVTQIITDVSRQPGIERLRLIDGEGQIIDSNHGKEVGYTVDKKEEPCLHCHKGDVPLEHVPTEQRWRIIENAQGQRSLIAMEVIRNEATCANASCHEHPASQKVLGVVDITYSLAEVDRSVARHAAVIIGLWLGFTTLLALGIVWLLKRKIYAPLRDLESGAARISQGDLDHVVPVRGEDEFGRLAGAFNAMGTALQQSRNDTANLIQTLEARVQERSGQLLKARAEAAHSEKLASIGMLASGIAHELNNPLTGVLTFTSLLRKKTPAGTQDAEDLDLVIRETKRCAGIIRRLLDFAREKVPVKGLFDLNQVVRETVAFVERSAELERIEIHTRHDPALPQVFGDADLIKQVVLNIVVNAQQAIEGQGRIDVITRLVGAPGDAPEQQKVEVAVTDTGCGIAPEHLSHIFDPFFTTKEVGKGTGLGLSVSYGIVASHGGNIEVDSEVGSGTTFRIVLPVGPPLTENNQAPIQAPQSSPLT